MAFKKNPDGTKTWTNSSGTYSYTRDKNGHLVSRTTSSSSGSYSKTTDYTYSGGRTKATGSTTTYPGGSTVKRKK